MTVTRRWWPWVRRSLTAAFFAGVGWLLFVNAREIEWGEVLAAMQQLPADVVGVAIGLGLLSYAIFCSFDLLGRHYTGHMLRAPTVVLVNFISYAFNLNLGSLIGGVAFRYRLYSRLGLGKGVITRIVSMSMLTNWLGYVLLAGFLFSVWPLTPPEGWGIDEGVLRIVGVLSMSLGVAYLATCAYLPDHSWTIRGHELTVPGWRMAILQAVISCVNWSVMGAIIWVLLRGQVDYHTVLSVLLVAAIAGVLAHVPAGLGVLEGVFIALLSDQVPQGELLAALLAYRAIYYLAPLAIATVAYAITELRARSMATDSGGPADANSDEPMPAAGEKKPRRARLSTAGQR